MNPQPPPPPLPRDLPLAINASKTHVVRTFTIDDVRLTTCRIDPTGTWVVAAAENFHVYRWPLAGPQSARTILHGHNSWVRSFDFSTGGNWLYSGGWVQRDGPMNCLIDKINFVAQSLLPFNKLLIEGIEALSLLFYVFFGVLSWLSIVAVKRLTRR